MTEEIYAKIRKFFLKHDNLYKGLIFLNRVLPIMVVLLYFYILLYSYFEYGRDCCVRSVVVPATVFVIVTIFRKILNAKRPYEAMNIEPLIIKDKKGQSFPSRHVLSVAVISMTGIYNCIWIGIVLWIITVIISAIRVLAGIHYIKDVLAGILLAIIMAYLGFNVV